MSDSTAATPIGKCEKCGFDLYEYMTHSCPTNAMPISSGSLTISSSPVSRSGEGERDEYRESRERAKKFLYKHGPSVTLDLVPTIMVLFAEEEAAQRGKETEK